MALATDSTPGSIVLAGDLTGTANTPQLRITGVVPGSYTAANVIVDDKGRVVYASNATFPDMDGDVASPYAAGSYTTTVLDNTTVTPGSYTYSNLTVDSKGRVTAATSNNTSFTFSGDLTGPISATVLNTTGVSAGSYSRPTITVDAKGRITSATAGTVTLSGDVSGAFSSTVLSATGVTAGSYNNANITVDAKGRVTATSASSAQMVGDVLGFPDSNYLSTTGVTAGSYVPARITVDAKGRITSAADSFATYTNKGILTVQPNTGLDLDGSSALSGALASDTSYGVVTPSGTNLTATSGALDVTSNVVKLDTAGQFTKAYGTATKVQSIGPLFPDLLEWNHYILGNQTSSPSIQYPSNAATGRRFTITITGLPLTGNGVSATLPSLSNWYGFATNGTTAVICGAAGTNYATSTNAGATWTSRSGAGGDAVIWNGTTFCMVGRSVSYTSTNGTSWTAGSTTLTSPNSIAWNGSVFVATSTTTAYVSSDGLTWSSNDLPFSTARDIVWNGTYFFVIGADQIARSTNGTSWTVLGSFPSSIICSSIATNNTGVILVGATSTTNVLFSTDNGGSWTEVQNSNGSYDWVEWTGSYWVASVNGSSVDGIFYSNDGSSWYPLFTGYSGYLTVGVVSPSTLVYLPNTTTTTSYKVTVTTTPPSFSANYKFSNTIQRNTNVVIDCVFSGANVYCTYM